MKKMIKFPKPQFLSVNVIHHVGQHPGHVFKTEVLLPPFDNDAQLSPFVGITLNHRELPGLMSGQCADTKFRSLWFNSGWIWRVTLALELHLGSAEASVVNAWKFNLSPDQSCYPQWLTDIVPRSMSQWTSCGKISLSEYASCLTPPKPVKLA